MDGDGRICGWWVSLGLSPARWALLIAGILAPGAVVSLFRSGLLMMSCSGMMGSRMCRVASWEVVCMVCKGV